MGKQKDRASSSGMAASLVPHAQGAVPTVGFGGYHGAVRVEPAAPSDPDSPIRFTPDVDGEVLQNLKRLGRKDPTTKLKALSALSTLFTQKPGEEVVQIVPQWAFEYKRLLIDYNREVRRATHEAMSSLVTAIKLRKCELLLLKMSCQKLSRQSLHLVLTEGRGLYSLRHMDISKLFYPSPAEALEAEAKAKMKKNGINKIGSLGRLPRPSIYYQPYTSVVPNPHNSLSVFGLFGESKNKILCSDAAGNASIYNTELRSLVAIPELNSPKGTHSVAVSIPGATAHGRSDFNNHTDSLYIMDMDIARSCCFEVLSYDPMGSWYWDPLPRPPFSKEPGYKAPLEPCFTVVDNTRICISTTMATYCFDTVTRKWNKMGDWVLPFKAEYAPELGLYLGLSSDGGPYDLCTLDNLSTSVGSSTPTVQHIGQEFELPDNWSVVTWDLVNLGSRRFCIASSFTIENDEDEYAYNPVTVFTGVEVLPSEQGHRMVKHKSKCFLARVSWVL